MIQVTKSTSVKKETSNVRTINPTQRQLVGLLMGYLTFLFTMTLCFSGGFSQFIDLISQWSWWMFSPLALFLTAFLMFVHGLKTP